MSPEGKLLAKADVSGGVGASPTLAADATIYTGSRGGKIIAFSGTHGGLMNYVASGLKDHMSGVLGIFRGEDYPQAEGAGARCGEEVP